MTSARFQCRPPNFDAPPPGTAPWARWAPATADAALPEGRCSTANPPAYVEGGGAWRRPRLRRMDCVIVRHADRDLLATEPRKVRRETELVVNQLRDWGTHQVHGLVTNAQDVMHVLRSCIERWEQARTSGSPRPR